MTHPDTGPRVPSLMEQAADCLTDYRAGQRERMGDLVDLLTPILWHTARAQGLNQSQAEDVVQTGWLRLLDHTEKIREPRTVVAWLITTVRREAWRVGRTGRRTLPDEQLADRPAAEPGPEALSLLRDDEHRLWEHVGRLSERCQRLLRIVAFAARPDYAAIAETLGMPIGSIGPTRGRCLDKLRRALIAEGHGDLR